MSYVRWSTKSDLYIYQSGEGETDETEHTCWSAQNVLLDGPHPEPFVCDGTEAMIEHVRAHIAQGDAVPKFVIPRLEAGQGFN